MTAGADGRIEAHINRGADLFRKRHFDAALQEFDAAIGLGCRLAGLFYDCRGWRHGGYAAAACIEASQS